MKELNVVTKGEWRDLVGGIPQIGDRLDYVINSHDENYYTNQNERIYRARGNNGERSLLKVSQLRMPNEHWYGKRIEPISFAWNCGHQKDVYYAVHFDEPKNDSNLENVRIGFGLYNSERKKWKKGESWKQFVSGDAIDKLVDKLTTYSVPIFFPWSESDIHIDVNNKDAKLVYQGMDAKTPAVAVARDYGFQFYKSILRCVLEKDEGEISHSYPRGIHPRITDIGADNLHGLSGL